MHIHLHIDVTDLLDSCVPWSASFASRGTGTYNSRWI